MLIFKKINQSYYECYDPDKNQIVALIKCEMVSGRWYAVDIERREKLLNQTQYPEEMMPILCHYFGKKNEYIVEPGYSSTFLA